MAEHLEIELKWALDEAAHAALGPALERTLGPPRRLEQDNRFFDSRERHLRRAALNLRLRRENDRLLMTCKGRGGIGADGEHRHTEWEEWLDPALWPLIDHGQISIAQLPLPPAIREALAGADLAPLGGFTNLRLEFRHDHGAPALLCLDRTDFLGARIDHELEIETAAPQDHAERWGRFLHESGIPYTHQPLTKFARYLALTQV